MNIRYIRGKNAAAVDFIEPYLLPDEDIPASQFVDFVKMALKTVPGGILIVLALDEDEPDMDKTLKGFVIAMAQQNVKWVNVTQMHVIENLPDERISLELYLRVTTWAQTIGRTHLQMETERDPRGWTKKFGFQIKSVTMIKQITDDFDADVARRIHTLLEKSNEQGRPEDDQQSDEGTAGVVKPPGGVPGPGSLGGEVQSPSPELVADLENRPGSDEVLREPDRPADSAIQPSVEPGLAAIVEQIRQRNAISGA